MIFKYRNEAALRNNTCFIQCMGKPWNCFLYFLYYYFFGSGIVYVVFRLPANKQSNTQLSLAWQQSRFDEQQNKASALTGTLAERFSKLGNVSVAEGLTAIDKVSHLLNRLVAAKDTLKLEAVSFFYPLGHQRKKINPLQY